MFDEQPDGDPYMTDTELVMSAVWALVRSAPNFDGRQQHVAAAIDAAIVRAVETERERWAKLCRDMMPAEGVIRRTLLDLERAILTPNGAMSGKPKA